MNLKWKWCGAILIIIGMLGALGCQPQAEQAQPETTANEQEQQSVQEGMHTHVSGLYQVPVPVEEFMGGKMMEQPYALIFTNDFGSLYRIENIGLPPEEQANLDEMGRDVYLEYFLNEMFMKQAVLVSIPTATVDHKEYLPDRFGGALYARLNLPGGSILAEQINGSEAKRLDARRGTLIFLREQTLYIVGVGLMEIAVLDEPDEAELERRNGLLKTNTLEFADTIQFL